MEILVEDVVNKIKKYLIIQKFLQLKQYTKKMIVI